MDPPPSKILKSKEKRLKDYVADVVDNDSSNNDNYTNVSDKYYEYLDKEDKEYMDFLKKMIRLTGRWPICCAFLHRWRLEAEST